MRTSKGHRVRLALAAGAAVLATAAPAQAFYWKGWPGAKVTTDRTITTPTDSTSPWSPPGPTATPIWPPGTDSQPPITVGPTPPVEHIPEPATGTVGLLGLAALGAVRWVLRRWQ